MISTAEPRNGQHAEQRRELCCVAGSLHHIDTLARSDGKLFDVSVALIDGTRVREQFTAKELANYRSFVVACLHKTGIVFGDSCYERCDGAAVWREEISTALSRGEVLR